LALIGGAVFAVLNFFGKDSKSNNKDDDGGGNGGGGGAAAAEITEAQTLIDEGKYSEAYRLLKGVEHNAEAKAMLAKFRSVPVKIKEENVAEMSYKYDKNNLPIELVAMQNSTEIMRMTMEYGSEGRLTKVFGDGESAEYIYGEDGVLLKTIDTRYDGSQDITEYMYDANGKMVGMKYKYSNGITATKELTYDANGNLIKEAYIDSDYYANTNEYTYDANGNIVKKKNTESNGYWQIVERVLDDKGNVVKATTTDSSGGSTTTQYVNSYDENGFLTIREARTSGSTVMMEYKFVYVPYELSEDVEYILEIFN
jgi:hypothetical protein